jgi:hypothetical protein
MPEPINFDFDDEIDLKIGGKTYRMSMDFSSLLHARIQRWFASQNADDADDAAIEQTGIDLVAKALAVERAVAAGFKPMQRKQLLAFLSVGPYPSSEAEAAP